MKTAIFYFTGTGNSLALAQELRIRLENSELIPLASLKKNFDTKGYNKLLFVFPVYGGGIPAIVATKLQKIRVQSPVYIGAICNYAGGEGAALSIFADEFEKHTGHKIDAGWGILMPGNYIPLYGAESQEKINKILSQANETLATIANEIKNQIKKPITKSPLFPVIKAVWKAFAISSRRTDRRFRADDSCTGCGLCTKICPVNNISSNKNGKPVWHSKCLQCMACLQYCPEEAIHCFWWTRNRRRYHHPLIHSRQIIAQKSGT
ncbi:MAG: EFR1 family ferrodoxin [Candidatus Rifleibacteriota bacterium]